MCAAPIDLALPPQPTLTIAAANAPTHSARMDARLIVAPQLEVLSALRPASPPPGGGSTPGAPAARMSDRDRARGIRYGSARSVHRADGKHAAGECAATAGGPRPA